MAAEIQGLFESAQTVYAPNIDNIMLIEFYLYL